MTFAIQQNFCLPLLVLFFGSGSTEIFRFRNQRDGNYLDTLDLIKDGARVTVFPRNDGAENQKWELNLAKASTGQPTDFFTYAQDGVRIKVMDEDQISSTIGIWGDVGVGNQRWTIRTISNGAYQIVNAASNRCLTNLGAGMQLKCVVCNANDPNQSWTIENFNSSPPTTWLENWFDHRQNLRRVFADKDTAIFYDPDLPSSVTWTHGFVSNSWRYIKSIYGNFGPDGILYANFHRLKYGGGHPGYFFSSSHAYRNVIDCGSDSPDAWEKDQGWYIDVILHEISHIVETCYRGFQGTPARV